MSESLVSESLRLVNGRNFIHPPREQLQEVYQFSDGLIGRREGREREGGGVTKSEGREGEGRRVREEAGGMGGLEGVRQETEEKCLLTGDAETSSETSFPCTALFRMWMKPSNSS